MLTEKTRRTAARPSIHDVAALRLIGLAVILGMLAACGGPDGASGTGVAQAGNGQDVNAPYFLGGDPLFRNGSAGTE